MLRQQPLMQDAPVTVRQLLMLQARLRDTLTFGMIRVLIQSDKPEQLQTVYVPEFIMSLQLHILGVLIQLLLQYHPPQQPQ